MKTNIKPMKRPCCTPILPLVYDESLSYYETICKLKAKMDEIIIAINDGFEDMVREQLDKLFIDTMYDEETETLTLVLNMRGE